MLSREHSDVQHALIIPTLCQYGGVQKYRNQLLDHVSNQIYIDPCDGPNAHMLIVVAVLVVNISICLIIAS